jgi:hypothetical protein
VRAFNRKTHAEIRGTSDTVLARANTVDGSFERGPDGSLTFEHAGESEIYWDSQETIQRNGADVFEDENGDDVLEADLLLLPDCDDCGGDGKADGGGECPICDGYGVVFPPLPDDEEKKSS